MPDLKYTWTDEQIEEVSTRALLIFDKVTEGRALESNIAPNVYQGILNMCGQVEMTQVAPVGIDLRSLRPNG